jgi:predicted ATPase
MDYTAVGQTAHLAARMEQLADPGAIVITPATLVLAESYVEVSSLGPVPVKGLADPVEVYEVTGAGSARTRLQAGARRGLTRFVGRDAELAQLRHAQQLAGSGHGQLAAIVGEAGVGKSRLVYEFTHSHRLQGWLTLEAASVSYGKATSYLPVIDLLKGYFKIQVRDDLREIREKVTGKLLALDRALEPILTALLALLDVPVDDPAWPTLDPAQRRQRTLDAVKGLLLREAREQPVLVIFEDLHWVDSETQALLDTLVENLGSASLLLVVNYRPEYQHAWGRKTYYSQLRLDALPAESAGELLDALLGDDPGLAALKQLLVKRGNPFFLEETVWTLVETKALVGERGRYRLTQPVQAIQVPPTVQVMLAARIDRLPLEDKRLLQIASVVGKDLPFAVLQAIADRPDDALRRGLDRLQAAEFLYETGLYPDLEYSFKHALTHEVAYGGLLQERRRELHARVVGAIETLHRDRLSEHTERLAHHASAADLWDKAAHYLRESGRKAFARSANTDATNYFERALVAIDRLPENRENFEQAVDVRIELRTALQVLRDLERQGLHLTEALRRAEVLGDQARVGQVLMYSALHAALTTNFDEALRLGSRAWIIAEALGDLGLQVGTTNYLAITHFALGNYAEAARYAQTAITLLHTELIGERFGQARLVASLARATLGLALGRLGRFSDALARAEEALLIAEAARHPYSIASELYSLGVIHLFKGDNVAALRVLERGRETWQTLQSPPWGPLNAALGLALCRTGDVSRGLPLLEAAPLHARADFIYPAFAALAEGYLLVGRSQESAVHAQQALELARTIGARANEAIALHFVAEAAAASGQSTLEAVSARYQAALSLAEALDMRPLVAHCHLGLGKLYRRRGKRQEANEYLTTATTMYREMGMMYWLEQAAAETARLG